MSSLLTICLSLIGYVCVGAVLSYLRWQNHVGEEIEFYDVERKRFMQHHKLRGEAIPEYLRYEWKNFIRNDVRMKEIPPKVSNFQLEVLSDVVLWPIVILILFTKFLLKLIFSRVTHEFNKVTTKKLSKLKKDLE